VKPIYFKETARFLQDGNRIYIIGDSHVKGLSDEVRFRRLEILPLVSQYILSLLCFVINDKNLFTLNSDKYNINIRCTNDFYQPLSSLTAYQKGVYCMGIKVYNSLPPYIKGEFHNPKKFETCLKHFLHAHYFYSIK
jgi:hypothetical protein